MNEFSQLIKGRRFVIFATGLVMLALIPVFFGKAPRQQATAALGNLRSILFGTSRPPRLQSVNTTQAAVVNRTQALQVEAWEQRGDGRFHLVVRNVGSKDVNGYVVVVGSGTQITKDLTSG